VFHHPVEIVVHHLTYALLTPLEYFKIAVLVFFLKCKWWVFHRFIKGESESVTNKVQREKEKKEQQLKGNNKWPLLSQVSATLPG
jgi:hypothetical protein